MFALPMMMGNELCSHSSHSFTALNHSGPQVNSIYMVLSVHEGGKSWLLLSLNVCISWESEAVQVVFSPVQKLLNHLDLDVEARRDHPGSILCGDIM